MSLQLAPPRWEPSANRHLHLRSKWTPSIKRSDVINKEPNLLATPAASSPIPSKTPRLLGVARRTLSIRPNSPSRLSFIERWLLVLAGQEVSTLQHEESCLWIG